MGTRAVLCAALLAPLALASPAAGEPTACRRAIQKATGAYARTVEKIVEKCKQTALAKGVELEDPPDSFSRCTVTVLKTPGGAIAKAADKMSVAIAKACGGADRNCVLSADNDPLAAINWDIGSCMNFPPAGASCTNPIENCDDVGSCLECIVDHTVEAVDTRLYGAFNPASFAPNNRQNPGKTIAKCQVAAAKGGSKLLTSQLGTLAKCWDTKLSGKTGFDDADACPDTDPKLSNGKPPAAAGDNQTVQKLLVAEQKSVAGVCKRCGGDGDADKDFACDAVDQPVSGVTIALDDIVSAGFACAEVEVPANAVNPTGRACGQYNPVDTVQKYVDCTSCQLEFKADCLSFAMLGDGTIGAAEGIAYPAACKGL
jgi:hypothetical protein